MVTVEKKLRLRYDVENGGERREPKKKTDPAKGRGLGRQKTKITSS